MPLLNYHLRGSIPSNVYSLYAMARIWIETQNEGLVLVTSPQADSSGYYTYQEGLSKEFSLPSNHIYFFKEMKDGTIWVGTEKGLVCLVKDETGVYKNRPLPDFPSGIAYTLYGDYDGE